MRIIQNGYNYADSSQNYHEFFVCTHKYHPFRKTSESGWNHPPSCLGKYIMLSMCNSSCRTSRSLFGLGRFSFCGTNCAGANDWGDKWPSVTTPKWVWVLPIGANLSNLGMPGCSHSGQAHAADRAEGNLPPWGFSPFRNELEKARVF